MNDLSLRQVRILIEIRRAKSWMWLALPAGLLHFAVGVLCARYDFTGWVVALTGLVFGFVVVRAIGLMERAYRLVDEVE